FDGVGATGCEEVLYCFWFQLRKLFVGEPEHSQFSPHFLRYDLLGACESAASAIAFSALHLVEKIEHLEGRSSADRSLFSYDVVRKGPHAVDDLRGRV